MGCSWCDVKESWIAELHPLTDTDEIVKKACETPAKAVVVTGGEPVIYNLEYLTSELGKHGIERFIETSGVFPLTGSWEWICLSPKKGTLPVKSYFDIADELKVIVSNASDLVWAEKNSERIHKDCRLFLQPEWSVAEKILPEIIEYAKHNPKWSISLQSHKYMNIS